MTSSFELGTLSIPWKFASCAPMQNSAQCWACSKYLVCTCWLSEWIMGAEEAEIICLRGLSIFPLLCPPPSPSVPHIISHTHIHAHPLAIYPSPDTTEHFFFMDSPEARALPNPFFPGTIWLFCFCNAARVVCQRALCKVGAYSFKPLY